MKLFLVFIGGGTGSMLRYLIAKLFDTKFPHQTMLVNLVGSFLIGLLIGLSLKNSLSDNYKLLLATGFCGGFTTFSTFAFESHQMLKSGDLFHFFIYVLGSLLVALLMVFLGIYLAK